MDDRGVLTELVVARRNLLTAGCAMAAGASFAAAAKPAPGRAGAVGPARLSLNENAFGCSPNVAEAIQRSLVNLPRYTELEAQALTAEIAAREGVPPQQIVLGAVLPALGVHLGLQGGPGGQFIYSQPGFTDLVLAAQQTGGTAVAIDLNERLENDLAAIRARVNTNTRAIFIVNPHNPSGTVTENQALRSFVSEVARRTLVIVDEAYLEFTNEFAALTLVDRVRAGENVVVFRTFDKIYGLAALQFGYAIAPAGLADSLHKEGLGAPHSLNQLAVVAAAAALRDTAFVAEARRKTARERDRWHRALDELKLRHTNSCANFVFFEAGLAHEKLAATFLENGISIGRAFPPFDHWARISIGLPDENERAISALREIIRTHT